MNTWQVILGSVGAGLGYFAQTNTDLNAPKPVNTGSAGIPVTHKMDNSILGIVVLAIIGFILMKKR
jgi:hypothetical protein